MGQKWTPILALLGEMDETFLKSSEYEHKDGELFHQFLVAVSPKSQRRGLCGKVLTENLALATKKGFKRSVIECTGKYSNAAAIKLGYIEDHRVDYASFELEGQKPFLETAASTGHDACVCNSTWLKQNEL